MEHMNADAFKSKMHSLAYGNVMAAAARDLQAELKQSNAAAAAAAAAADTPFDVDALADDPDLAALHRDRLASLAREAEARAAAAANPGAGVVTTTDEGGVLEATTTAPRAVVHFFHPDFATCAILDRHLTSLARAHPAVRFLRTPAPDAPFLSVKLKVRVLPALLSFVDGVCVGRCAGFDAFGGDAAFPTAAVERELRRQGGLPPPPAPPHRRARAPGLRRGVLARDSSESEGGDSGSE